jgi:hypothetical protein
VNRLNTLMLAIAALVGAMVADLAETARFFALLGAIGHGALAGVYLMWA